MGVRTLVAGVRESSAVFICSFCFMLFSMSTFDFQKMNLHQNSRSCIQHTGSAGFCYSPTLSVFMFSSCFQDIHVYSILAFLPFTVGIRSHPHQYIECLTNVFNPLKINIIKFVWITNDSYIECSKQSFFYFYFLLQTNMHLK